MKPLTQLTKNKEQIQKWKPSNSDVSKIKMEVSTNGKYVRYSDYLLAIQPQSTSQDAERLKYLHTYYCAIGQLVDTSYDDWIANIDAMKESEL